MDEMIERVRSWLEWPREETGRLEALAAYEITPGAFRLGDAAQARETLVRVIVPTHAIDEIVPSLPTPDTDPEAWWLLERLYHALTDLGSDLGPPWPAPVPRDDALTRYFHLYVFLAALPHARELHARRGIPEAVTWATLRDLGLQVAHHQARYGTPGFDGAFWLWQHFRGGIYLLGRLQYNFWHLEFEPADAGLEGYRNGDPTLGVHIPPLGPLTPEACDDSLQRAHDFFPRYFPERPNGIGTCGSWLLDTQLADYLPETSNIVRFQRRFIHVPEWSRPGDDDVIRFVFGRLPATLDDLPQETTLQRALVRHLKDGHHWQIRLGWLSI